MAGEWIDASLGDIVELKRGYDLPQQKRRPGTVPVVSSSGVSDFHADAMVKAPGVVTGRYGTLGQVFFIRQDFWPLNTTLYVRDFKGNDPRFISYFLRGLDFLAYSDKAAVPGVNRNHLHQAEVRVPSDVGEQRAMAHILGKLDDKIELNRRMSETLVAMARALFKSWFLDFDPVRAKAEGRDPGLPRPLADLFPNRLVNSELGEIPEGWEVMRLSDLCSTQYGFTASAIDRPVGPKFLRVTDINKRNWIDWGEVPYCEIDLDKRQSYGLQLGDLVVARMADPGKSAIIEERIDAVFASYLVRLKTNSLSHSYYLYGFLKSDLYAEYAEGTKSGSVQSNMNAKVIVAASIVVPPDAVLQQFLWALLPLRGRLVEGVRESRILAALRDTLLPRLISGALRVKDAKRFVGMPI